MGLGYDAWMLRHIGHGLLWALVGYGIGAFVGYGLVSTLSSNAHDRSVEAAMTAAFVFGPGAAILGFVVGLVRSRGRR